MKDEDKNTELAKFLKTRYIHDKELYFNGEIEQLDRNLTRDNDTVGVVYCLICDESIPLTRWEWEGNHSKICEKCKKAILKLRKMLDEE